MKRKIRLALVDDHALFRKGIANLLREFEDVDVVFDASNGKELQAKMIQHPDIDVVLMDINMPFMDGYNATRWLKEHHSMVHVLTLSMFDEDEAVIGMLRAGSGGYILKESSPAELYHAINEVRENGVYLNEFVSGKMLHSLKEQNEKQPGSIHLTEREIEFIRLCVSELTYKEIASQMKIATRSVENYRENLFEKLQVRSRVGLVLYAIKNQIVDCGRL